MNYRIGERVIHWTYGPGIITGIDEKSLGGQTCRYYVLELGELTLWVPFGEIGERCIRLPTPSIEFKAQLNVLSGPGDELPDHQFQRKNQLNERMRKKSLAGICSVIRDLTTRSQLHKLNRNDITVLRYAEECLLDEWELSLGAVRSRARRELDVLLGEDPEM